MSSYAIRHHPPFSCRATVRNLQLGPRKTRNTALAQRASRVVSWRNQALRSVSSIQTSIMLVEATSM